MSNKSSPRSQTKTSFPALWTELASLTVSAFTPEIVQRLREVAALESFEPTCHIPLFGAIVIRHVRLLLEEPDDQCDDSTPCSCSKKKTNSIKSTSSTIPRRASYRDAAYQAVRLRKIVPAVEDDQSEKTTDTHETSSFTRRLSIHVPRRPRSVIVNKNLDKELDIKEKQITSSEQLASTFVTRDEYEDDNADEYDDAVSSHIVIEKRNVPTLSSSSHLTPFPRATGAATINMPSSSSAKLDEGDTKENFEVIANSSNRPTSTRNSRTQTIPTSRLAQLRRQRMEKKKNKTVQRDGVKSKCNA